MAEKMRVSVESIRLAQLVIDNCDKLDINDIEWTENGQPIAIRPELLEDWRFVGLCPSSFVEIVLQPGRDVSDLTKLGD